MDVTKSFTLFMVWAINYQYEQNPTTKKYPLFHDLAAVRFAGRHDLILYPDEHPCTSYGRRATGAQTTKYLEYGANKPGASVGPYHRRIRSLSRNARPSRFTAFATRHNNL